MAKLVRFPIVGLVNSLVYAVATTVYISQFAVDNKLATFLGYLTSLPIAFFGHREFTFGSTGGLLIELRRFCLVHAVGVLISWLSMSTAVDFFGLHYAVGIFGAVVLVPIVSFFVFDRWVFCSAG